MSGSTLTIVSSHWMSLDGYVAGPDGEMDWIRGDSRMSDYENGLVGGAGGLLLGSGTYQDFAGYWPMVAADEGADPEQRRYARRVDALPKLVASRSFAAPGWGPAKVLGTLEAESIAAAMPEGGTLVTYGSVQLVRQLAAKGLLDEVHLLVHPLALGGGTPLFDSRVELERVRAESFASGVTLLVCRPARD